MSPWWLLLAPVVGLSALGLLALCQAASDRNGDRT